MKKLKDIKRVFLYDEDTPTAENYEGAYKHIKAISDDEKHYFEFIIDQENYEKSLQELCDKFEKFCVDECGFDDCRYCEIWETFDSHNIIHLSGYRGEYYSDTLFNLLAGCSWAGFCTMESKYRYLCSHLKFEHKESSSYLRPPTFEEFIKDNGYDEREEPLATKKLFSIFISKLQKREFTQEELNNINNFIDNNIGLSIDFHQLMDFINPISDYLLEEFNIDIFDKTNIKIKDSIKKYVLYNLKTLSMAILRIWKYDRKAFKKLFIHYPRQVKYIKSVIKNQKYYGYNELL